MLIDTHCHLDAEYFSDGALPVLERARAAGVARVVVVGVGATAAAARFATTLSAAEQDVSATVGMHPHDASHFDEDLAEQLEALSHEPGVVAIGEAGLDYHYMRSPKAQQQLVFRRMIALARERNLPLVVHSRAAPDETLAILEEEQARDAGGIIHCFSEDRTFAKRALDLDFDISFSGIVTFKGAKAVQDVARWLPADRFMVETDSPYLAPAPLRGEQNEPA
ncbi:MAG: TatD family hydrolase, partial [Deltaproteobacteria bacterium]|nr:TatD family hydrolase [Deltaproteobacteria bacterium]